MKPLLSEDEEDASPPTLEEVRMRLAAKKKIAGPIEFSPELLERDARVKELGSDEGD